MSDQADEREQWMDSGALVGSNVLARLLRSTRPHIYEMQLALFEKARLATEPERAEVRRMAHNTVDRLLDEAWRR